MYTGYDDLPIVKFIELAKIMSSDRKPSDIFIAIVAYLEGVEEHVIRSMPIISYSKLATEYSWVNSIPSEPMNKFVFNGIEYIIDADFENMTVAQFGDLELFVGNGYDNIVETFSLLVSPLNELEYNGGLRIARAEAFKQLPTATVLGVFLEFKKKAMRLNFASQKFMEAEAHLNKVVELVR